MTSLAGTTRGGLSANPLSYIAPAVTPIVNINASGVIGLSFQMNGSVLVPLPPKSPPIWAGGLSSQRTPFIAKSQRQKFVQPTPTIVQGVNVAPALVVDSLACPWAMTWLPDATLIFTQRDRLLLSVGGHNIHVPNAVSTGGDGGVMGVAVDPNYSNNKFIYIAQTIKVSGLTANGNALVRYTLSDGVLTNGTNLVTWDSNTNNNGGVVKFGPDGCLYVGTGTASNNNTSQNLISNNGKILRMNTDGTPATGNPFGSVIWAYGFHNVVGMTWEGSHLWCTDQGIKGYDEINLVKPKQDYGFPLAVGQNTTTNLFQVPTVPASLTSGPDDIWSPCGITFVNGSLYFGCLGKTIASGLGSQAIGKSKVVGSDLVGKTNLFVGQYGRIRDVALGPDGNLYFSTSNNDGIGVGMDDAIYKVAPAAL